MALGTLKTRYVSVRDVQAVAIILGHEKTAGPMDIVRGGMAALRRWGPQLGGAIARNPGKAALGTAGVAGAGLVGTGAVTGGRPKPPAPPPVAPPPPPPPEPGGFAAAYGSMPTWAQYGIPLGLAGAGAYGLYSVQKQKDEEEAREKRRLLKFSSEHPLVAGFLRACGQAGLNDDQIVEQMQKAAAVDPSIAAAFKAAGIVSSTGGSQAGGATPVTPKSPVPPTAPKIPSIPSTLKIPAPPGAPPGWAPGQRFSPPGGNRGAPSRPPTPLRPNPGDAPSRQRMLGATPPPAPAVPPPNRLPTLDSLGVDPAAAAADPKRFQPGVNYEPGLAYRVGTAFHRAGGAIGGTIAGSGHALAALGQEGSNAWQRALKLTRKLPWNGGGDTSIADGNLAAGEARAKELWDVNSAAGQDIANVFERGPQRRPWGWANKLQEKSQQMVAKDPDLAWKMDAATRVAGNASNAIPQVAAAGPLFSTAGRAITGTGRMLGSLFPQTAAATSRILPAVNNGIVQPLAAKLPEQVQTLGGKALEWAGRNTGNALNLGITGANVSNTVADAAADHAPAVPAAAATPVETSPEVQQAGLDNLSKRTGLQGEGLMAQWEGMDPTTKTLLSLGLGLGAVGILSSLAGKGGGLGWLLGLLGVGGAGVAAAHGGMFGADAQTMARGGVNAVTGLFANKPPAAPAAGTAPNAAPDPTATRLLADASAGPILKPFADKDGNPAASPDEMKAFIKDWASPSGLGWLGHQHTVEDPQMQAVITAMQPAERQSVLAMLKSPETAKEFEAAPKKYQQLLGMLSQ